MNPSIPVQMMSLLWETREIKDEFPNLHLCGIIIFQAVQVQNNYTWSKIELTERLQD